MAKTLYVSDLDGTLLRSDQTISSFTAEAIRELCAKGMVFSYATARSYPTALKATSEITLQIPLIVKNGAQIRENGTGRQLHSEVFSAEDVHEIMGILEAHGLCPIVYHLDGDRDLNRYCPERLSPDCRAFLRQYEADPRYAAHGYDSLCGENIFYFRCVDTQENLQAAHEALKDRFRTLLFCDMYSDSWWLEIMPQKATKADAILRLKEMLGCDRVVCFGDGSNDMTMFRIADECYAMENADDELKAIATGVIGSNNDDGVAKWLLANYK